MDHTFLADDHLALNETTFTWPDRIIPIIQMRYTCFLSALDRCFYLYFSNSLIIPDEKTKEITTVKEVWKCDLNYDKILPTLALNSPKNY